MNERYSPNDILVAIHIDLPGSDRICPAGNRVAVTLLVDLLNVELAARGLVNSIGRLGELNYALLVVNTSDVGRASKIMWDVLTRNNLACCATIFILDMSERLFRSVYPRAGAAYSIDKAFTVMAAMGKEDSAIKSEAQALADRLRESENDTPSQ